MYPSLFAILLAIGERFTDDSLLQAYAAVTGGRDVLPVTATAEFEPVVPL